MHDVIQCLVQALEEVIEGCRLGFRAGKSVQDRAVAILGAEESPEEPVGAKEEG